MADSESERASDAGSAGGEGVDPCDLSALSEKELKKWQKNSDKWRLFLDFLLRHVAIVTFKYNCFEREQLTAFMRSLERAETLRAQAKPKKGEVARVACFRQMGDAAGLLEQLRHHADAARLRQLLDLSGRLRCLAMIAGGFTKALRRGDARGLDRIQYLLDHWRGLCVRSYDYAELRFRNADVESLDSLERRYLVWSAVVRTCLHVAQQFLKKTSEATGLALLHDDPRAMQQHMRAAEFVLAAKLHEVLARRVSKETREMSIGSALLAPKQVHQLSSSQLSIVSPHGEWSMPNVSDVDPELLQPIPDNGVLMSLPAEPPKEVKAKKGKGGKKGKKGAGGAKGKKKKKR